MSDFVTILPPNATDVERAIESATARADDVPVPIRHLWNANTCPAALLPFLAWALSVDEWDSSWAEEDRRKVISEAVGIHRIKGTPAAVRRALAAAGYGDAVIVEKFGNDHSGTATHNSAITHEPTDHWAEYRIYLQRPITIAQAAQVRKILATVAPARAHLKGLFYDEALNIHDSTITHNSAFTHGVA